MGPAPGRGPRRADRHRLGLLDGRRRRAAGRDRRARPPPRRARRSSTRPTAPAASGPGGRGAVAEAGRRGRGRRRRRHARQGARRLRRVRGLRAADARSSWSTARGSLIFSTAPPPPAVAGALAALELLAEQPRRVEKLQANADALRDELAREGFEVAGSTTQIVPLVVGDAELAMRDLRAGDRARRLRPGDPPADGARGHLAAAPGGDGLAHQGRAARGRAGRSAARRCRPASARARACRSRPRASAAAATPASAAAAASTASARPRRPRVALARPLRHRHRHGRRQDRRSPRRSPPRCARDGVDVAAFKPVVTGPRRARGRPPADHELLAAAAGRPADEVAPQRFGPAVSPHLAAELAGTALDPAALVAARARRCAPTSWSSRASAGCSCRSRSATRSATSRVDARLPVVVAARPGLGTINHTLLTRRGGARGRPRRARGRAHAVAAAARASCSAPTATTIARLGGVEVATLGEVGARGRSARARRRDAAVRALALRRAAVQQRLSA